MYKRTVCSARFFNLVVFCICVCFYILRNEHRFIPQSTGRAGFTNVGRALFSINVGLGPGVDRGSGPRPFLSLFTFRCLEEPENYFSECEALNLWVNTPKSGHVGRKIKSE